MVRRIAHGNPFGSTVMVSAVEHYHQRSNVETAYSMMKGKFGDSLRSKSDVGQVNEALCKALCHNLCALVQTMQELGIEPAFRP